MGDSIYDIDVDITGEDIAYYNIKAFLNSKEQLVLKVTDNTGGTITLVRTQDIVTGDGHVKILTFDSDSVIDARQAAEEEEPTLGDTFAGLVGLDGGN